MEVAKGEVLTEALGPPEAGMLPTVEFTDCWALADGEAEAFADEVKGELTRLALEPKSPGPR